MDERERAFERGQRAILEKIVDGAALGDVLGDVVRLVEAQSAGMLCSILLLDDDRRHLRRGAAPSLPPAYVDLLDGLPIGPTAGSCGAAAFHQVRVVVDDIATHSNWADYRHLALPWGLRACWSTPIVSRASDVLGTFAMYYREPRRPSEAEIEWVDAAAHVAAVAIMRDESEVLLQQSEARTLRLEHEARARESIRATVYDCVDNVIFYLQVDGPGRYRFLSVNSAFLRSTGIPAEAVIGRLVTDVLPPASHDLSLGKYAEAIRKRAKVSWEEVASFPAGTRYGEVTVVPVFGSDGACTNLVGTVVDVTARRHGERERAGLQAQVYQEQRLQALGALAGGIAHDFDDLLSVILRRAEVVRGELQETEPSRAGVDDIKTAALRATDLTRQLLAFSQQQVLEATVIRLNETVASMDESLRRLLGADIELTALLANDLADVSADRGQVEQIVRNLAVNGREAMPRGGKLTIETANVVLDEDQARGHAEAGPGRFVLLSVTDTGTGMSAETQARIFEPFFTTKDKKEEGRGTGLGLAAVFGIVTQSGGHISVDSELDRGTTFRVYLPALPVLLTG